MVVVATWGPSVVWHGLRDSLLMGWEVCWALVVGFFISALVQAWVPRQRIERTLGGRGARTLIIATGLGAASSSCSYAAVAIAKSLFQKGASAIAALAFMLASTNLVWELALLLWVLLGWQFTVAEYVGGIVMIALMALLVRAFVPRQLEERARVHARQAASGHQHPVASGPVGWRRVRSVSAWSDVALNFRGDWQMLYKEIAVGLLLAGFLAQVPIGTLHALFLTGSPHLLRTLWGALIGPVIAVLSFVCSVGNVPLAAVLWSGGISFAGVVAFIFADLIIVPILAIYRKYYGTRFAARIAGLMFMTMVLAAVIVEIGFAAAGLRPAGARPTRQQIFAPVGTDYKLVLNCVAAFLFSVLFLVTMRRGATDPVCGMKIDRGRALARRYGERTLYFCSEDCLGAFERSGQAQRRGALSHAVRSGSPGDTV